MIDYEYYYDQYRRVPRPSTVNQKELLDYNSTASNSTYSMWTGVKNRPLSTTYIDGSALIASEKRPSSMKDSFPKSKGRRRPTIASEKKIVSYSEEFMHSFFSSLSIEYRGYLHVFGTNGKTPW